MWGTGLALAAVVASAGTPAALLGAYRAAWDRSDAGALAGFYAADGELQTPYGVRAEGRAAIGAFYAAAFQRGYAGSRGGAELEQMKPLGRGLVLVRGRWSIAGARTATGDIRAPECGAFIAAMRRETRSGDWRIVALDEQAGSCPPGA